MRGEEGGGGGGQHFAFLDGFAYRLMLPVAHGCDLALLRLTGLA